MNSQGRPRRVCCSPLHRSFLYQKRPGCYPTSFPSKTDLVIRLYVFHNRKSNGRADGLDIPAAMGYIVTEGFFYELLQFGFVFRSILFRCSSDSLGQKAENESEILRFIWFKGRGKRKQGGKFAVICLVFMAKRLGFPHFYNFFEKWKKKVLCIRKVVCIVNTEIERGSVLDASF